MLNHWFLCQTWGEEKQNNEESLTSSASQWCSSLTPQHLQREQKQAEVKNTLPSAGKCKQSSQWRHLTSGQLSCSPSLCLQASVLAQRHISVLLFITEQSPAPVFSPCRSTWVGCIFRVLNTLKFYLCLNWNGNSVVSLLHSQTSQPARSALTFKTSLSTHRPTALFYVQDKSLYHE